MPLAADPIVIEIAGEAYELRPTLRAATRLARKHGDLTALYGRILSDHVTAFTDVIREGSGSLLAAADFLTSTELPGLHSVLSPLKLPLLRFVLQLAGHEDTEDDQATASGEPMSLADYHTELFRIGTGWLGWTPAATWEATPAEIIAAQRGRTDLIGDVLKAVFGEAQSDEPRPPVPLTLNPDGTDTTFDRAGLAALKAKIGAAA